MADLSSNKIVDHNAKVNLWCRSMRIWQWSKNLLVFVPLVTSHRLLELEAFIAACLAFLSFSLLSSATYLLNDLRDVDFDLRHPRKKRRPIASGEITALQARIAAVLLGAASLGAALMLTPIFLGTMASYLFLTTAYTLWVKKISVLDTVLLAGLYSIRLLAGHASVMIELSSWLITFSFFVFLSLALLKRHSELLILSEIDHDALQGRGYKYGDHHLVRTLGICSGLISVLVLMLYANSPAVQKLYAEPRYLLLLCPILTYWIGRMWIFAERKLLDDDPVIFTIRDRWSYMMVALAALVMVVAK